MLTNTTFKSYTRLTVSLNVFVPKRGYPAKKILDSAKKVVEPPALPNNPGNQGNQNNPGNALAQQRDNAGAQLQAKGSETPVPPTELVKASPEKGISPSTSPREQPAESHKHYKIPEVKHPEPILDKSGVQQALRKANNNFDAAQEARKLASKLHANSSISSNNTTTSTSSNFRETPNSNSNTSDTSTTSSSIDPQKSSHSFKILTQDSPSIVRSKLAIQHFLQGFKSHKSDRDFIENWLTSPENTMTRAFQVALEICFKKTYFSAEDLKDIFADITLYEVGASECMNMDSSTLYTALQVYYLKKKYQEVNSINPIVLAPPPNTAHLKKESLSPKDQRIVLESQQATGNTISDVKFLQHHYDYKGNNFKYLKNHLVMLDYDEISNTKKVIVYLNQILTNFNQTAIIDPLEKDYLVRAIQKLDYIINDTKSTSLEKLDEWNAYIFLTLERRPLTILFPLIIPGSISPVNKDMLVPPIVNMNFPLKKALETFDIKNILREIYTRMSPEQLKDAKYILRGAYDDNIPIENN